jgi:hypothetical protein
MEYLKSAAPAVNGALTIEHLITSDMDDGQPLPPLIEDGLVWHVVRRAAGSTLWRQIFLTPQKERSK